MPETENMTIDAKLKMVDQLRRQSLKYEELSPAVATAAWMETLPAYMRQNPQDGSWHRQPLSIDEMKMVIREMFGGSEADADRVFTEAVEVGRGRQAGQWIAQGLSAGEVATNGAKAGWALDEVVAAIDQAYAADDSATTRSALARDPKTPPIYLEALAGRALVGDLGLAIALRSNPAARALVDRSVPTEQLTLDGPDI